MKINKCVNKNCNNDITTVGYTRSRKKKGKDKKTSWLSSYKTALCGNCRKAIFVEKRPLYVECDICKKRILVKHMTGGVRITCGLECAKERNSRMNQKRYQDSKKLNNEKINIGHCKRCNKYIKRKKTIETKRGERNQRKFCSKACYDKNEYWRVRYSRIYKKQTRIANMSMRWILNLDSGELK